MTSTFFHMMSYHCQVVHAAPNAELGAFISTHSEHALMQLPQILAQQSGMLLRAAVLHSIAYQAHFQTSAAHSGLFEQLGHMQIDGRMEVLHECLDVILTESLQCRVTARILHNKLALCSLNFLVQRRCQS